MGKASRSKTGRSVVKVKKTRNWFPLITTLVVTALVVGLGVAVFAFNQREAAPAEAPAATSVNRETGAISVGDGPVVMDEYLDFGCPFCGSWNERSSESVAAAVENGDLTLNIHPVSILDNAFQGTGFSTRGANAAYCVAETSPNSVYGFVDLMFKNQPNEGTEGLTDAEILGYAEDAGATDVASCIENQDFADYVAERTAEIPVQPGAGGPSTPTVLVDGEFADLQADPAATIAQALANSQG